MPRAPKQTIRAQLNRRTDGRVSMRVDLAGFTVDDLELLANYLTGKTIRPAAEPTVTNLGTTMLIMLKGTP